MRINQENVKLHSARVGVGEQLWAAGVLEVSLDSTQRALAKQALDNIGKLVQASQESSRDLIATGNRCIRNGESESNLKELLEAITEGHQKVSKSHGTALAGLKAILTGKQQAGLLAWILGNKASRAVYHPIWATTLAALKKTSLGRHLPCFQSLSAIQLDTITAVVGEHHIKIDAAQAELAAAAKVLVSSEGDDSIKAAVFTIGIKRDALAEAESKGRDAVVAILKPPQRTEVVTSSARWAAPKAGGIGGGEEPRWWSTAVESASLSDDQKASLAAQTSQLEALREALRSGPLEEVESRLPFEKDLEAKVIELEAALKELSPKVNTIEKAMLASLQPEQQKALLAAALAPLVSSP